MPAAANAVYGIAGIPAFNGNVDQDLAGVAVAGWKNKNEVKRGDTTRRFRKKELEPVAQFWLAEVAHF